MLEDRIIVQDRGIDAGLAALMQNANKGMDPAALMAMMNNGGFGGNGGWWWIWIIKDSDHRYCLCLRLDSRDDQFNIYNYQSNDWSSCNRRRRDHRSGWTRTWFNISICWIQYDGYF